MSKIKETAKQLAAEGYFVFPVQPNKKPYAGTRGHLDAVSADEGDSIDTWPEDAQLAIYCARSSIVVVDIDVYKDNPKLTPEQNDERYSEVITAQEALVAKMKLTPTRVVRTPSGGLHFYWLVPEQADPCVYNNTTKLCPSVDTRGHGYVLAPPSAGYVPANKAPVAPMPGWLLGRLVELNTVVAAPARSPVVSVLTDTETAYERCLRYVDTMSAAISGAGGHAATMAVARVAQNKFALSEGEVLDVLRTYNARCLPPWSERELIHKARSAFTSADPAGLPLGNGNERQDQLLPAAFDELELPAPQQEKKPSCEGHHKGETETVLNHELEEGQDQPVAEDSAQAEAVQAPSVSEPEVDEAVVIFDKLRALHPLAADFCDWSLRRAKRKQPGLLLSAFLGATSAIAARRYKSPGGLTANTMLLAIGDTGAGKSFAESALVEVMRHYCPPSTADENFSSYPVFIRALQEAECDAMPLILRVDEYGDEILQMQNPRGFKNAVKKELLKIAQNNGTPSTLRTTLASGGGEKLTLAAPAVALWGCGNEQSIAQAFSGKDGALSTGDGFLTRHIFFRSLKKKPRADRHCEAQLPLPESLRLRLEALAVSQRKYKDELAAVDGEATQAPVRGGEKLHYFRQDMVGYDVGAKDVFDDFCDEVDDRLERDQADRTDSDLSSRLAEQAERLAIGLAVFFCENGTPSISVDVAKFCCEVARFSFSSIKHYLALASSTTSISVHEEQKACARVLQVVRQHSAPQKDGQVLCLPYLLSRHCRVLAGGKRRVSDVLQRLVDEGDVLVVMAQGPSGPKVRGYKLAK